MSHGLHVHDLTNDTGRCFGAGCPCTAYRPAPSPQPDFDSGLTDAEAAEVMASVRSADVPPSSPPRRVRQPEPTGLVERVARTWLVSQNVGIEDHEDAPSTLPGYLDLHAARAAALAVADWLAEPGSLWTTFSADLIRREVEGSGAT